MGFKENLKEKLKDKLDEKELELLPAGFQNLGELIILNLKSEVKKHKKLIGEKVLELYPRVKTVCSNNGEIKGEFREPQIEVIAGERKTEVIVLENGCKYKFDVRKLMFAKGNINERVRIARDVKPGEVIVDMFSGLGYFTVPIGKLSMAKRIYSIEKNKNAVYYLKENLKLNNINNVEVFEGDNRKIIPELVKKGIVADRVVMGYLPPPKDFLEDAFKIVKKGSIIHYEDLLLDEKLKEEADKSFKMIAEVASKFGFRVKLMSVNFVKGYRPRVGHYVLDILVG